MYADTKYHWHHCHHDFNPMTYIGSQWLQEPWRRPPKGCRWCSTSILGSWNSHWYDNNNDDNSNNTSTIYYQYYNFIIIILFNQIHHCRCLSILHTPPRSPTACASPVYLETSRWCAREKWWLCLKIGYIPKNITGWWFGTCFFWLFHILGMSSSQLTNSYFSEGLVNHQPVGNMMSNQWI